MNYARDTMPFARVRSPAPALHQEIDHLRQQVRGLLPAWGLPDTSAITLLNESENITFRIDPPGSPARTILRVYRHGYHDTGTIRSELAWMKALGSAGEIVVPAVVPTCRGDDLQNLHDALRGTERHAAMFTFLEGREPSGADLPAAFESLGRLAAGMHAQSAAWQRPPAFRRPTWDVETMIGRPQPIWGRWQDGLGLTAEDLELLDRAGDVLARRLDAFGRGDDRFGLIHADLRLTNVLVEGDVTKVIDFDDCGFGWHLYDLSAALTFIEDRPEAPALSEAWLRGYRAVRPLTSDERDEIPTFNLLRRILIVAWIASHIESETAQANGEAYTRGTCAEARRYLARFG
ncbi:phosphotransferase enzyme family protein [Microvirga pudoricolor]|uniref:phosphotransferase enzyme family protein n=1 Tax=Microvirga pudoricolor TaxID=2778729 RepID=UPI00195044C7|nr:phosphotransferase [Microvirga pudoricolor]MBM6592893.1 phosphotransferase [Microvirga pudoricolor]